MLYRNLILLSLFYFGVSLFYFGAMTALFGMQPEPKALVKGKTESSQDKQLIELKKITGKTIDQKVGEINSLPKEAQDAFKNQEMWAKPISIALESFEAPEYGRPNLAISPLENCVAFTNKAVYLCDLLEEKKLTEAVELFEDKDLINPEVAFSPDGKTLAAAFNRRNPGKGAELTIWDVATKKQLNKRNFDYSITALNWTSQGHIAIGFNDLKVLIFDTPLLSVSQQIDLTNSGWGTQFISSIAFSNDGAYLAITLYDRQGITALYAWDADARRWQFDKRLHTYENGLGTVGGKGFRPRISLISPDNKYLACGCDDEEDSLARVRLFNLITGKCVKVLEDNHKDRIVDLSYSPSNGCLATIAYNVLTIFDTDKRISRTTLFDEGQIFDKGMFTPTGNCLAALATQDSWASESKSNKYNNCVIFACGSIEEMLCKQALINAQENKSIKEITHLLSSNTWKNLPKGFLKTALYTKALQLMKSIKEANSIGNLVRTLGNSVSNKHILIATCSAALIGGLYWLIRNSSKKE